MKISIITATINTDDILAKTIESVNCQSHIDVEHIIIDGIKGRPTPRRAIGKVIYHEPNGIYEALNFGISKASGDIIGIVHGGDTLASADILKKVNDVFEKNPDIDFIYGDVCYVNCHGHMGRVYKASGFRPSHLEYGMAPPHPSLYIKRGTAEKIGKYKEDFRLAADLDMWMRLFGNKTLKSVYVPEIFVKMAQGGASTTLKARLISNNKEKLKALRLNGYPANPFKLIGKYVLILRDKILK